MKRTHTVTTEEEFDEAGELISATEEHIIVETHNFMIEENEDDEDLMFVGKKESDGENEDVPLIIIADDNNFW